MKEMIYFPSKKTNKFLLHTTIREGYVSFNDDNSRNIKVVFCPTLCTQSLKFSNGT